MYTGKSMKLRWEMIIVRANFGGGSRMVRDNSMSGDKRQFENKKVNKKRILIRLWKYIYGFKLLFILTIILTVVSNVLALLGPRLSGLAIDAIGTTAGATDFNAVFKYAFLMLIFYVLSEVLSYIMSVVMIRLSRQIVFKMRKDVFDKLTSLPVSFFDKYQTGDIVSIISYDIDTVNASLSSDFIQICKSIITVIGSFIMMVYIAPKLIIIFVFTIPLSIWITKFLTSRVRPLFSKRSAKLGQLNAFADEMIRGHKTTKAYHAERAVEAEFNKKNKEANDSYAKAEFFGSITGPSVNFINNLSLTAVSVFGGLLYLAGSIGLGDVSSFVLYSRRFSGPINEIANIFGELQSSFAAAERVFALIDAEPEKADEPDAAELKNVRGDVMVKDVCFGHTPGKQIIKNFNLNAEQGKLIAIAGATGAGKTTIINLLMRFYDVDSGDISVDGTSIYNIKRDNLRRSYTMVLQDTWLFQGTVYENLAYGRDDVTMEDVIRAAKAAKIHNFITRLPDGYNTVLTGDGANISKGQKQLLTIARAMLLDSKMLILDEATSNVDTRTEQKIQAAMRELMKGKTCFVIAHRLSTIKNADTILLMDGGRIIEQGTHDELMRSNGAYAKLYYSQFENSYKD